MNILYIACSCSPYHGSEDKIGWNIPLESAKKNRVHVITRESQRKYIEQYINQNAVENLSFHYVSLNPAWERLLRIFPFSVRLNLWNQKAFKLAKELCRTENIAVVHQITPIEFRSIGDYGKIPGVKFVCGPIAGGQKIPRALEYYVGSRIWVERVRNCLNWWCRCAYWLSGKLKQCDVLLFANEETKAYLYNESTVSTGECVLTDVSIDSKELIALPKVKQKTNGKCVFLVVGRLVYLKGQALLLDALARIPKELVFECRVVGAGPEEEQLRKKCKEYDLESKVIFVGEVPYTQIGDVYKQADVFVMPSFREATGSVLLEAMAKGLPVITINRFGGATMLNEKAGWLYDGQTREEVIDCLKKALLFCIENPEEVRNRGEHARLLAEQYTWEERMRIYQKIYDDLVNGDGTT